MQYNNNIFTYIKLGNIIKKKGDINDKYKYYSKNGMIYLNR